MKKKFYLISILLLITSVMCGQTTHYQLPNNNFDHWGSNEVMPLPIFWYSFSHTECLLSPASCDMVDAAGGRDNHHKKVTGYTGYNGTDYACQLYAVERVGRTVNGLITTGRVRLASETLSSPSNYVGPASALCKTSTQKPL